MSIGFDWKKRLGKGAFGEVWLAIDKALKAGRAVKLILPSKITDQQNFFKEAQLLKESEHYNIVKVHEAGTLDDDRIYVSMEYLSKGSIEDYSRGGFIPLTRARKIIIDILRGLHYTHSKGIIHRDIKPANIMVGDNGEGKLSDFGLAVKLKRGFFTPDAREYLYIIHLAPEIFKTNRFTVASDIFAVGITFYRLINGDNYLPPLELDEAKQRASEGNFINRNKYRFFVPRSIKLFIHRAIDPNPNKRFKSALEMRRALERINIERNFEESSLENHMVWTSSKDNKFIRVTLGFNEKNKCYIKVEKGASKRKTRMIRKFSQVNLKKKIAERKCCNFLQDFVSGKEI